MKGEINRDWYCAGSHVDNNGKVDYCGYRGGEIDFDICKRCKHCHRKHPTPEQFFAEYGKEYPDDGAVYYYNDDMGVWDITDNLWAKTYITDTFVVCACTPWGKPPNDWRPE